MGLILTLFYAMEKFSAEQLENWKKIKDALEKAQKTDTFFYKRAVSIIKEGRDLMQW